MVERRPGAAGEARTAITRLVAMSGEASRANGKLGGRPKEVVSKTEYGIRKKVRKDLRELCQCNEPTMMTKAMRNVSATRRTYIDITWLSAAMHFRPQD